MTSIAVYAAQPREGTETLSARGGLRPSRSSWFMQLNPARGRKRDNHPNTYTYCRLKGLCSSTPRGDGNWLCWHQTRGTDQRFMQLNPARGRKLTVGVPPSKIAIPAVYAAQPREGTETLLEVHRA